MNMRDLIRLVESSVASPTIQWTTPASRRRSIQNGDEVVVHIDVARLDASWSRDYVYVGQGGEGGTRSRYPDFGKWLETATEPVEMPEVGFGAQGWIVFNNGRHRFSWLRDHGLKTMPVLVPADDADEIQRRFGSD